jgi:hypothetical protein
VDPAARDQAVTAFRHQVHAAIGFTWFDHQADWQLASEGWTLQTYPPLEGDYYTEVLLPDPTDVTYVAENRPQHTVKVKRAITPRLGGVAHNLANLAAYKGGKSYGGSAWLTGFAILPKALVQLIGSEYATSEPEFTYLCEMLCSAPPYGMGMKYHQLLNDKRAGRMRLALKTGAQFECKSWERREGLKGAKVTAYYYAEAYQLPGMICYNSISQNLRQLRGFAAWTTTPDEPWVSFLHDRGHDPQEPDWHCSCGARDDCNPFTFDQKARDRDDPDKGGIMTRERFEIAHNGRLGTFVGRVYAYARGEHLFSPATHPQIFKGALA